MAKKPQQQQRKNEQQKQVAKSSGGVCSCFFSIIRFCIILTAVAALASILAFVAHTYHSKQRLPTIDEFKIAADNFATIAKVKGNEYYVVVDKNSKIYYARFEKDYLPVIQKYTKEYSALAVEKFGDLQVFVKANVKLVQTKVTQMINDFQSPAGAGASLKSSEAPKAQQAKATQAPRSAEKPTPKPQAVPEKPKVQPTAAPTKAPVKPAAAKANSKEKREL